MTAATVRYPFRPTKVARFSHLLSRRSFPWHSWLPNTGVGSPSSDADEYDLTRDGPTDLKCNYAGVPPSHLPKTYSTAAANFTSWLTQMLYSPILGLVRSSTLFFMLKITGHIKNLRWTIHVSQSDGTLSHEESAPAEVVFKNHEACKTRGLEIGTRDGRLTVSDRSSTSSTSASRSRQSSEPPSQPSPSPRSGT